MHYVVRLKSSLESMADRENASVVLNGSKKNICGRVAKA